MRASIKKQTEVLTKGETNYVLLDSCVPSVRGDIHCHLRAGREAVDEQRFFSFGGAGALCRASVDHGAHCDSLHGRMGIHVEVTHANNR